MYLTKHWNHNDYSSTLQQCSYSPQISAEPQQAQQGQPARSKKKQQAGPAILVHQSWGRGSRRAGSNNNQTPVVMTGPAANVIAAASSEDAALTAGVQRDGGGAAQPNGGAAARAVAGAARNNAASAAAAGAGSSTTVHGKITVECKKHGLPSLGPRLGWFCPKSCLHSCLTCHIPSHCCHTRVSGLEHPMEVALQQQQQQQQLAWVAQQAVASAWALEQLGLQHSEL